MRRKVLSVIFILVTVGTIFLLSGCSIACTGLAAVENSCKPEIADTVSVSELEKIRVGSQVIVNLKDGNIVEGEYTGGDTIPNEEYAEKYSEIQKQMLEGSFLPSTGDTITVSSEIVTQSNIKFHGFDNENIILSLIESDNPIKLKLESLESIEDKNGNLIGGKTIRNLIYENEIPPMFLPRISIGKRKKSKDLWGEEVASISSKELIYINDIEQIQIKSAKYSVAGCFLLGLAADAIIVGLFFWALALAIGSA
jgi:hypothetical protein